jgi:hypothetical protein
MLTKIVTLGKLKLCKTLIGHQGYKIKLELFFSKWDIFMNGDKWGLILVANQAEKKLMIFNEENWWILKKRFWVCPPNQKESVFPYFKY